MQIRSRYTILAIVILLYLIPITLISNYGRLFMPADKGWNLLAFGMLCSTLGTLILFWLLCQKESEEVEINPNEEEVLIQNQKSEAITSLEEEAANSNANSQLAQEYLDSYNELQKLFEEKTSELTKIQDELIEKQELISQFQQDQESLEKQLKIVVNGSDEQQKELISRIENQDKFLIQSQKTISELREDMDKKLQQIASLETKVSDLTYEIKTLIQLAEIENQTMPIYANGPLDFSQTPSFDFDEEPLCLPEKQVKNDEQAAIQLKRCIDIAQKITGASYYNKSNSRFKDLAVDNYTLDLRRLFDSLRMENASALIFYSQKENKVLFINNQSKSLLGWSPDKFVQSFLDIVDPSLDGWKQAISSLSIKNEAVTHLKMKNKSGHTTPVSARLGIIPTGIFRHHVLGVLYTQ